MNGPRYICAIVLLAILSTALLPCIPLAGAHDTQRASSRTLQGFTEASQGLPKNIEYAVPGVGKFNNDNYPDIVSGILSWMHATYGMDAWVNNNGAQSWTLKDTGLPTTGGYGELAVGDLNSDGFDEIVAPHENAWSGGGANGIKVYKSDGAASPTFSAMTSPTASGEWECAALGDIDKDGDLDLAASSGSAGVKVWKGNGGTTWTDTSTGLPTSGQYYGVAFGDMNKDGNLDLVAAGNGGGLRVYTGNGGTSWSLASAGLPGGQYLGINISDVDNDGNPDIVAGLYSTGIEVWTGNGGSGGLAFTEESTSLPTTGFYSMMAVGDVDMDGNKDIWAGEAYGGGTRLYLGNGGASGSCSWTRYSQDLPANGPYTGAIMADFDLDGDLDLLASDSGSNSGGSVGVRVFLAKVANGPPVARAGVDQTVPIGTIVHLDASNSTDKDGAIAAFQWNMTAAPTGNTAQLNSTTVKSPWFEAQKIGKYTFTLAVRDDKTKWGLGEAMVNVTVIPLPNKRPIADAGLDKDATIFTKVQLNGSASWDDAQITAYKWNTTQKPSQTNVTLDNDKIVNPSFTPDYIGLYKFTLTVKDVNNTWAKDDAITITVKPAGSGLPIANAGPDMTIELGHSVTLNAMASTDDQKIVVYHWSVASEPPGSYITVQDVAIQNITPQFEGPYDMSLTVKDNDNLWSLQPDQMRITVLPKNLPPVSQIDSPQDGAVFLSTDIVSFDGSGSSDPEGKDITMRWASDRDGDLGALPTFTKNLTIGKHILTLSVKDDHNQTVTASVSIEVKLDTLPTAVLTAKPTIILKGETVKFDGTGSTDKEGAVEELLFDFGDASTATWGQAKTASHVYAKAGHYNATLRAKDAKSQIGPASAPILITVAERPTAAITASLVTVDVTKVVTFSASNSSDPDGKVVSYYFDFGDNTNSGWVSEPTATKTYATAGQYSVSVKVKDDLGYESINSASVNVLAVKPKKPSTNNLGAMMLPLLLVVVVVVIIVVLIVVMKMRKGKAAAAQAPTQVDLVQQQPTTYPAPPPAPQPGYDPNQYQQPPQQQYPQGQYQNPPYDPAAQQPPQQYYQGPGQQ